MKSTITRLMSVAIFALLATTAAFAEDEEALECEQQCREEQQLCVETCWDTDQSERCREACGQVAADCIAWCH